MAGLRVACRVTLSGAGQKPLIFIMNSFTPKAFGLATTVKEFSGAATTPMILARRMNDALLAGSRLRPVGVFSTLVGVGRAWHIDDMFATFCLLMTMLGLLSGRVVVLCPQGERCFVPNVVEAVRISDERTLSVCVQAGQPDPDFVDVDGPLACPVDSVA